MTPEQRAAEHATEQIVREIDARLVEAERLIQEARERLDELEETKRNNA